jgi:DivIVA domain-containing protein
MAATRLDHPALASAEQIRRREFVTTRRGYDPDQVRNYLEEIAEQVELMNAMVREARMDAEAALGAAAQPSVDPYERLAQRVSSLIREADETAERLRIEGRRDAERIMLEARTDAERIRTEAQTQAGRARAEADIALHRAKEQADRTISGLATRRQALVEQLAQMQERLLGVASDLEAAIEVPMDATGPEGDDRPDGEDPSVASSEDGDLAAPGAATAGEAGAEAIVDVRTPDDASPPHGEVRRIVADDILDGLDDPSYEELWDGTEAIQLEVPDIPPLDLSWGDEDGTGSS